MFKETAGIGDRALANADADTYSREATMHGRLHALLLLPMLGALTDPALARRGGISGGGCVGCHAAGEAALELRATPASFGPGAEVSLRLTVASASASVAGVFISCGETGSLSSVPGEGLAEVSDGLVHTTPKSSSGGSVAFEFLWTAPDEPGSVRCMVYAVAGNGDGRSTGDAATEAAFDFLFGCDGATYYRDLDADGVGVAEQARLGCSSGPPPGYAGQSGDCDDHNPDVFPGAVELCNNRDDNCNGQLDENSLPVEQYPDADGDGYYSSEERASGDVYVGCLLAGYAAEPGDCRPDDAAVHPGAEEVCNLIDDDCDGRVDTRVRPQCGEGRCRRDSGTCELETCLPGEPLPEECNFLDDDCNGVVDDGVLCELPELCIAGRCRLPDADGAGAGGSSSTGGAFGTGAGPSSQEVGGSAPDSNTSDAGPDLSGATGAEEQPTAASSSGCSHWSTMPAGGWWGLAGALSIAVARRSRRRRCWFRLRLAS